MFNKKILLFSVILFILPSVYSATSELYPSEAVVLDVIPSTPVACEFGTCHSGFYSKSDVYTFVTDNNLATKADITLNDKSLELSFFTSSTPVGDPYYLRLYFSGVSSNPREIVVFHYINATSLDLTYNSTFSVSESGWVSGDITQIVEESYADIGYVKLRVLVNENSTVTSPDIAEVRMLEPVSSEFLQRVVTFISEGVDEARINESIRNTWSLQVEVDLDTALTINNCTIQDLDNPVNITGLQFGVNYDNEIKKVVVDWFADSNYVSERKNYEVACAIEIDNVPYGVVSQFVYINADKSVLDYILLFVQKIAEIMGIIETNQALLNESLVQHNNTQQDIQDFRDNMTAEIRELKEILQQPNMYAVTD